MCALDSVPLRVKADMFIIDLDDVTVVVGVPHVTFCGLKVFMTKSHKVSSVAKAVVFL